MATMQNNGNQQTFSQRTKELKYIGVAHFDVEQETRDSTRVSFPTPQPYVTEDNFAYLISEFVIHRLWSRELNRWKLECVEFQGVRSGFNPRRELELITLRTLPKAGFIREAYELSEPAPITHAPSKRFTLHFGGKNRGATLVEHLPPGFTFRSWLKWCSDASQRP